MESIAWGGCLVPWWATKRACACSILYKDSSILAVARAMMDYSTTVWSPFPQYGNVALHACISQPIDVTFNIIEGSVSPTTINAINIMGDQYHSSEYLFAPIVGGQQFLFWSRISHHEPLWGQSTTFPRHPKYSGVLYGREFDIFLEDKVSNRQFSTSNHLYFLSIS